MDESTEGRPDSAARETRESARPRKKRAATELAPGRELSGYRLVRQLGEGGFAEVWEAEQAATARRVALKLLTEAQSASTEALRRFEQEGRIAASLSHARCVRVLGAERLDGIPAIVMELMPGGTLEQSLDRDGPLSVPKAVDAILDVIEGLEAAAELGILHRDVKPSNCFVDEGGRVRVGDFGIAKRLQFDAGLTKTGSFIGTPAYSSPEQVRGKDVDVRSDIYSVGATLHALLTGHAPFESTSGGDLLAHVIAEKPRPMKVHGVRVPWHVQRAVSKCLAKDPGDRFQGYAELRRALEPFASAGPQEPAAFLGRRVGAASVDLTVYLLVLRVTGDRLVEPFSTVVAHALFLAMFAIPEMTWGRTLGKVLLDLRVVGVDGGPISPWQALGRAALFLVFIKGPDYLLEVLGRVPAEGAPEWTILLLAVGYVALYYAPLATARPSNGWALVQDVLTRTRVRRTKLRAAPVARARPPSAGPSTPEPRASRDRRGSFQVTSTVWSRDGEALLSAFDPALGRDVWIHEARQPAQPASMGGARPGEVQCLQSGVESGATWRAYERPPGLALVEWVRESGGLPWEAVRMLLLDLAREIAARRSENAGLTLSIDQVFVDAHGHARILDFALVEPPSPAASWPALLASVARSALEGSPRGDGPQIPRVPLPGGVRRWLASLDPRHGSLPTLTEAVVELTNLPEQRAGSMRPMREDLVAMVAFTVLPLLLAVPVALAEAGETGGDFVVQLASILALLTATLSWLAVPAVVSAVVGGASLFVRLASLATLTATGERASRLRVLARSAIGWSPLLAAYALVVGFGFGDLLAMQGNAVAHVTLPLLGRVGIPPWPLLLLLALGLVQLAGVVHAYVRRSRGWNDRLAGTWVLPA